MIGSRKTIIADILHKKTGGDFIGAAFSWLSKSFLQFDTITPLLHFSNKAGI